MNKKLILLLCMVFLIGNISAFTIDDWKTYDEETKTFKIENSFTLGKDLVRGTLKTPLNVRVGLGYQKVAEFEIETFEDYENLIKSFELQDLKQGGKNIEKQVDVKYWGDVNYESPVYSKVCKVLTNGTHCENKIVSYEIKTKGGWLDFDKSNFKKGDVKLISLWTNVQEGDYIEWIPTISTGKDFEIKEWASWTADLNTDLFHYYTLNSTAIDQRGLDLGSNQYDFSLDGGDPSYNTGIIGNALILDGTGDYATTSGGNVGFPNGTTDHAISLWINSRESGTGVILSGDAGTTERFINVAGGVIRVFWAGTDSGNTAVSLAQDGSSWSHFVLNRNKGRMEVYLNNSLVANSTATGKVVSANWRVGADNGGTDELYGDVDEIAFWNRSLTTSEISDLYNAKEGITYQGTFFSTPTVYLNTPANLTNSSSGSITFNCSANEPTEMHNVSLIINKSVVYTESNTGVTNISLEQIIALGDGVYNWTCNATDYENEIDTGETRILIVDTTPPVPTITFPLNQTYTTNFTELNYTYDELHPANCWYSDDSEVTISSPVVMGTNFTISLKEGSTNLTVICNDTTFNNIGRDSVQIYLDSINPDVNITFPINSSNHTSNTIDINYTRDITDVDTCWYSNDSYTSITILPSCENITNVVWAEGKHNVTVWVNDSLNNQNSSNVTFGIDTLAPDVNITYPYETVDFLKLDNNLIINFSVSDDNLAECWGSFDDGTNNISITCGDNNLTINITSLLNNSFTFWANDSLNNVNKSSREWSYNLIENDQTFNDDSLVGTDELFIVNISYNNTKYTNILANFYYNNTKYIGIQNGSGVTTDFYKTISIPNVVAKDNQSLYWTIGLNDGSWHYYNLSISNQTVDILTIDNCSTNSWVVYNFTIKDEKTQTKLNPTTQNTTAKITFSIYTLDRNTIIANISTSYVKKNSFAICLNNNLSDAGIYSTDLQLQYYADAYSKEFYHIQRAILNDSSRSNNISLYDLDNTTTQKFTITYKDDNLLPVSDALIQIQRNYIDEGVYKTVEIPKTDFNGETTASMETNDVLYTIIVTKYGEILATFDEMEAVCQTPSIAECTIGLSSFSTSVEPDDFTTLDDFSYTLTYNETSRTIKSVYSIPSGSSSTILLNATLFDSLGTTEVCHDSLTSSSGTLTCVVPISFGNGTTIVTLTKDDSLISKSSISLEQNPSDIYGVGLIFLNLFLFLTLIGLGIGDNPITMGIFLILGGILAVALNLVNTGTGSFIGVGATILWIIVAIIIIIVKGVNRQ